MVHLQRRLAQKRPNRRRTAPHFEDGRVRRPRRRHRHALVLHQDGIARRRAEGVGRRRYRRGARVQEPGDDEDGGCPAAERHVPLFVWVDGDATAKFVQRAPHPPLFVHVAPPRGPGRVLELLQAYRTRVSSRRGPRGQRDGRAAGEAPEKAHLALRLTPHKGGGLERRPQHGQGRHRRALPLEAAAAKAVQDGVRLARRRGGPAPRRAVPVRPEGRQGQALQARRLLLPGGVCAWGRRVEVFLCRDDSRKRRPL
mmetsp:Transcript_2425/g.7194  ORF Transcript_2425/g.7194 Transcript_2425/m.7194 type:complete len:255 (-) Transcript_2425:1369-2133(-)